MFGRKRKRPSFPRPSLDGRRDRRRDIYQRARARGVPLDVLPAFFSHDRTEIPVVSTRRAPLRPPSGSYFFHGSFFFFSFILLHSVRARAVERGSAPFIPAGWHEKQVYSHSHRTAVLHSCSTFLISRQVKFGMYSHRSARREHHAREPEWNNAPWRPVRERDSRE